MTLESIYYIGQTIAVVAILASLVFVGLQVRQNTEQARLNEAATRAAAAQAVHSNFAAWYTSIQNQPSVLAIIIKGLREYGALNGVEKAQFIAAFMSYSSYHQDAFFKWKDGSLSPELWRGWELVAMNLFMTPGGKEFWAERGYMFSQSFQNYIDTDLMKRAVHPDAKPLGVFKVKDASGKTP